MKKNESGLTLLELLGAITILGMVIVLFVSISEYTTVKSVKNDEKYEALLLAENELKETVHVYSSTGTIPATPATIGSYTVYYNLTDVIPNPTYGATPTNPSTQVSMQAIVDDGTGSTQKLITVTVAWGS